MTARVLAIVVVAGCGGHGESPPACTAEDMNVTGTPLTFTQVDLGFLQTGNCTELLITSTAELDAQFGGSPPTELANVDFTVDRIFLGSSNPLVEFAVDDGTDLVVGQEPLCQGIAPSCIAYVVHGTTRDTVAVIDCPYRGPDPCLAP